MEMEYSTLYDLIKYIERGTKLHIGVLFFGSYGNERLIIPHSHQIHTGEICEYFKRTPEGFKKCLACRNTAIRLAIENRVPFGAFCVNGAYEYTHPVIKDDDVAAMIFIGNIAITDRGKARLAANLSEQPEIIETMEQGYTRSDCKAIAELIESYIKLIFELEGSRTTSDGFDPRIENIKKFIEENLEFLTDASFLAKNFGYNKKYLGRLFKTKTGVSLDEYINRRRIALAKQILSSTDESIINVSLKVGYNNVSYFNRIFRSYTGRTPSEWRRDPR